ncbi:DUF3422 domain-containing protein [Maritimibacter sp. 55A14]|uniref:DUF3422 family protein n=1 Tax=Maritimibacter sp. 55A14 TaxID=2174844 RepID=UPI000D615B0A|nr:DUF3422 domain-containing protein [Maritimibacter sp. 55A14]PWE34325.1 DUF3422 domain-containing protein [Maritimibacter sp. 55A14]
MTPIEDYPRRYALSQELHARPFPVLAAPCHAVFLAIKRAENAAGRDRGQDRAHLIALLDRFGSSHPGPEATHYFGQLGRHRVKWECHTEFMTYTVFVEGTKDAPFDPAAFEVFPEDWLEHAPGKRLVSALVRVEVHDGDEDAIARRIAEWFEAESLAISRVLDGSAVIATDFRIDATGHSRIAVFVPATTGQRRIGRVVQRLTEIETYKTMSMLGLPVARDLGGRMNGLEERLAELVDSLSAHEAEAEEALHALLEVSAELEHMAARHGYRFAATEAYSAIVGQRIEVLREARFQGRQTFREFMMRRFDPAIRTCASARDRLTNLTERAARAADLLRTRVDVERSAQNQKLLESMDRRADAQLRLQKTVEGLSVVAVSYYAVNLASYVVAPFAKGAVGLDKPGVTAVLTLPVVLVVWLIVRRIRKAVH